MSETTENGYTCDICGVWVTGWQGHTCVPKTPYVTTPFMGTSWMDNAILERIAKALEKIAEKLNE